MLQKFTIFMGKFIRVSKFSFSYYTDLEYLINAITDINFIKKYRIEHITELNKVILLFNETIKNSPLPADLHKIELNSPLICIAHTPKFSE